MSGLVLSRRRRVAERLGRVGDPSPSRLRTRVHGDYHLGQVLRTRGDFVILDFEGEPARSLDERREKQSPIKDVAGMLRSFSYAAYSGLMRVLVRRPGDADRLEPWARLWEQSVCSSFLRAYRLTMKAAGGGVVPAEAEVFEHLLEIYVLDKALYELAYELNNRPAWVRIPLAGILALPLR
jgi:maltose alpha-D-glucosyltransferase / alpha-amylase